MGLQTVIVATCSKGCTESRRFTKGKEDEARQWLKSHEAAHDKPRVYVGKHDPAVQARFDSGEGYQPPYGHFGGGCYS